MNALKRASLLLQFGFRPIRGGDHAERLESFYHYQAETYDDFRSSFLIGRDELALRLGLQEGSRWADFGCGTGYLVQANSEGARLCEKIWLVDLSPSLLEVARQRVESLGLTNVAIKNADVATTQIEALDRATFSYSLSMIPNWYAAVDAAYAALKPGGKIGIADFLVSRKHPEPPAPRQSWLTRHFWPAWFGWDNVHPNADHLPYVTSKFRVDWVEYSRTRVPGLPFLRPPCFRLIGTKC